jgi:hypothetical protein
MQIHFTLLKSFLIMVEFHLWCAWCCVDLHTHGVLVDRVYVFLCVYVCTCIIVLCPCIYTLCIIIIIILNVNNFIPMPYDLLFYCFIFLLYLLTCYQ